MTLPKMQEKPVEESDQFLSGIGKEKVLTEKMYNQSILYSSFFFTNVTRPI